MTTLDITNLLYPPSPLYPQSRRLMFDASGRTTNFSLCLPFLLVVPFTAVPTLDEVEWPRPVNGTMRPRLPSGFRCLDRHNYTAKLPCSP